MHGVSHKHAHRHTKIMHFGHKHAHEHILQSIGTYTGRAYENPYIWGVSLISTLIGTRKLCTLVENYALWSHFPNIFFF